MKKQQKLNNQRKCLVTSKVQDKDKLIRVVKLKSGEILVNSDAQGRGCYISKDVAFEDVAKKRVLDRAFKMKISKDIYEELQKVIKGD